MYGDSGGKAKLGSSSDDFHTHRSNSANSFHSLGESTDSSTASTSSFGSERGGPTLADQKGKTPAREAPNKQQIDIEIEDDSIYTADNIDYSENDFGSDEELINEEGEYYASNSGGTSDNLDVRNQEEEQGIAENINQSTEKLNVLKIATSNFPKDHE